VGGLSVVCITLERIKLVRFEKEICLFLTVQWHKIDLMKKKSLFLVMFFIARKQKVI
jgi:hypothetical protein